MYLAALAWLHLTAATVWVGSQLLLILAVLPALRVIEDPGVRHRLVEALTARYNVVGWASLAILAVTGLLRAWSTIPAVGLLTTTWYGQVLLVKVALVGGVMALSALHAFFIGPRLLALSPTSSDTPSREYHHMRRVSAAVSALNLGLSLAVLAAAVLLRATPF